MQKRYEIDMCEGRLLPKLLSFALPVMLSGVLQLAFNAADLVVVGRFAGAESLAAVGSTGSLISLVVNVLLGLGMGTNVLAARYYGAKNAEALQAAVSTTVIVAVVGGVLFGILGQFLAIPLLRLMGSPEEVLPLSAIYLRIYFAGLPVIITYNFASAALRAVGDTKRPLVYLTIAGVLNVIMNLFFVIVLNLAVAGVALATVLSQCVSVYLVLRALLKTDSICRLDPKHLVFSGIQFREILRVGLPAGLQSSAFSISNVLIQSSINSFGSMVMAGNSAAANIEGFLFVALDAMNQISVSAVSQNMGARKYDRVRSVVRTCIAMDIAVSVTLTLIAVPLREPLVRIYATDDAAVAAGCTRLLIVCTLYLTNGLQHMLAGVMRGHGYGILPSVITFAGCCGFRIFWIYTFFAANRTLEVLYLSYPISWIMTIVAHLISYFLLRKKAYARNELRYAAASQPEE